MHLNIQSSSFTLSVKPQKIQQMKQLFIFLTACTLIFASQNLAAQGKYKYENAEVIDTLVYAIWGSQSSSGSECGHNRSSSPPPSYRVVITDFEIDKPGATETVTPIIYQAQVGVQVNRPFKKTHNFKFKKIGKGKKGSIWAIDIPCSVEEATFTIDLRHKKNGKVKPLNLSSKSNKNQLTLSVDFKKQKVYALEGGKSFLGGFHKKLAASGKKIGNADKGSVKITIE